MGDSRSTKTAADMIVTLLDAKFVNHTAFMTHMRLLTVSLPERTVARDNSTGSRVKRVATTEMQKFIDYKFFNRYSRHLSNFGNDT